MFDKAYKILIEHEGGYVNDPNDPGGETYKGIARKFNPEWAGWKIIDKYKRDNRLVVDKQLDLVELESLVKLFYKEEYWDKLGCDSYPEDVAIEIFEQAVNLGIGKTVKHMQLTCNLLNRNGKYYPDIKVDGILGQGTKDTFIKCLKFNGNTLVHNVLNFLQGKHYIELMLNNPTMEKYVGWFERVKIIKKGA